MGSTMDVRGEKTGIQNESYRNDEDRSNRSRNNGPGSADDRNNTAVDQDNTKPELENFEDVLELVGTKQFYNILIFVACASVGLMTPMQILSSDFLGGVPTYWCQVEELQAANWTAKQIQNFAIPANETCIVYDYNYTVAAELGYQAVTADPSLVPGGGGNRSCPHRVFGEGGENSYVAEWDLVCDRRIWYSNTIAAAQAGMFLGSIMFGYLLDRVGRRTGMFISIALFVPAGMALAVSVNVYMFIALRTLVTTFGVGMYLGGFVLTMEACTPTMRSLVSSYYVLPWAIGYMATAGIAYVVRYWRYLQVALTAPAVLLYANFFIVPESARWLLLRGRHSDCLDVLKRIARNNKRTLPSDRYLMEALLRISPAPTSTSGSEPHSAAEWIRTWVKPQIHWRTPVIFFCWFAVAMVYYGVSQGAGNIGVNAYMYVFLGGVLEIISYLLLWPALTFLGRRPCLVGSFLFAAVCLLAVMTLQLTGYENAKGWLSLFSLSGKFLITASFHIVYIVSGELFVTKLRSLMIGEASVCARVGSISSPYINVMIGDQIKWAPSAFFGVFSLVAGLLAMLLPETNNLALDTVEEDKDEEGERNTRGANLAFEADEEVSTKIEREV